MVPTEVNSLSPKRETVRDFIRGRLAGPVGLALLTRDNSWPVKFEDHTQWLQGLAMLVTVCTLVEALDEGLGLGSGAGLGNGSVNPVVPLDFILRELEAIVGHVRMILNPDEAAQLRGLVGRRLVESRVPYLSLIETYVVLLRREPSMSNEEKLSLADGAACSIRRWLEAALVFSPAHEEDARKLVPLVRAARGQRQSKMQEWIDELAAVTMAQNHQLHPDPVLGSRGWLGEINRELEQVRDLLERFRVSLDR